jgi:biofilm PGA synthesis N-glycosyltransferase PgaC
MTYQVAAPPLPTGINQTSVGLSRFGVALLIALAWFLLSLYLAQPWLEELAGHVGPVVAWLLIAGIALAPGFMNAFQTASLVLRPEARYHEPASYPHLTILIAAFNEADNIAGTLRSLLAQRYAGEIDIIVIDDGSRDGTADVVRQLFPEVRLIVQPVNAGKAAALNRGLQLVLHSLVVTVDADSCLQQDALRYLVLEYLNAQPQTAAVAGAVFVANGQRNWLSRVQYWDYFHGIAATKRTQAACGGTLVAQGAFSLYRLDILHEIGGWPACVGEDIVVTWAILKRGFHVGYAEQALCFTNVPVSLNSLMQQRTRWARGMIEAFRHHPGILLQWRRTTFLVSWNLLFPWMDLAFTFGFIPGLVLALFGHYWLVGPITLALIPSALLVGLVMYRMSARVFRHANIRVCHDIPALIAYTFAYGLINHPASLKGYLAELLGMKKAWGTK